MVLFTIPSQIKRFLAASCLFNNSLKLFSFFRNEEQLNASSTFSGFPVIFSHLTFTLSGSIFPNISTMISVRWVPSLYVVSPTVNSPLVILSSIYGEAYNIPLWYIYPISSLTGINNKLLPFDNSSKSKSSGRLWINRNWF